MNVAVFLGPSLPLAEARARLDATFLPPVSMGDVLRAVDRRPRIIAIIDGVFEQVPAVWHKEILYALSRGIRVFGASSMGALRDAELHCFGMEGVGEVFEAFANGTLEDDDEVAVAHAAACDGFRCLSDAMVNIRAGLRRAEEANAISSDSHRKLLAYAKNQFYAERSWSLLLRAAALMGVPSVEIGALRDFVREHKPDVKHADAIRLLDHIAALSRSEIAPPRSDFVFEKTHTWSQILLQESGASLQDDQGVAAEALRRHICFRPSQRRGLRQTALMLLLLEEQAARHGVSPHRGDAHDATGDAALLPPERATALRTAEATEAALAEQLSSAIDGRLAMALARTGQLSEATDLVRRKLRILETRGVMALTPEDLRLKLPDLLRWYEQSIGEMGSSPEAHASAVGFRNFEEFVTELCLEYLLQHDGEIARVGRGS